MALLRTHSLPKNTDIESLQEGWLRLLATNKNKGKSPEQLIKLLSTQKYVSDCYWYGQGTSKPKTDIPAVFHMLPDDVIALKPPTGFKAVPDSFKPYKEYERLRGDGYYSPYYCSADTARQALEQLAAEGAVELRGPTATRENSVRLTDAGRERLAHLKPLTQESYAFYTQRAEISLRTSEQVAEFLPRGQEHQRVSMTHVSEVLMARVTDRKRRDEILDKLREFQVPEKGAEPEIELVDTARVFASMMNGKARIKSILSDVATGSGRSGQASL
jgi:DNA-binding MarR family transcriptional regulator